MFLCWLFALEFINYFHTHLSEVCTLTLCFAYMSGYAPAHLCLDQFYASFYFKALPEDIETVYRVKGQDDADIVITGHMKNDKDCECL